MKKITSVLVSLVFILTATMTAAFADGGYSIRIDNSTPTVVDLRETSSFDVVLKYEVPTESKGHKIAVTCDYDGTDALDLSFSTKDDNNGTATVTYTVTQKAEKKVTLSLTAMLAEYAGSGSPDVKASSDAYYISVIPTHTCDTPENREVKAEQAATCTSPKKVTYKCKICEDEWTAEEGDALGHQWGAAAQNDADTHVYTCTRADCHEQRTEKHAWDAGVVTKEPSITEEGVKTYTCAACKATKTESMPKLEHTHQYDAREETVEEATCTKDGKVKKYCSCGAFVEETVKATGHVYKKTKTVDSTCDRQGYYEEECENCHDVKKTAIAKKDHVKADGRAGVKSATCTEKGYSGDVICKNCGTVLESGSETAALGHSYVNGKCSRCNAAEPVTAKPAENNTTPQPAQTTQAVSANKELPPQTGDRFSVAYLLAMNVCAAMVLAGCATRKKQGQ